MLSLRRPKIMRAVPSSIFHRPEKLFSASCVASATASRPTSNYLFSISNRRSFTSSVVWLGKSRPGEGKDSVKRARRLARLGTSASVITPKEKLRKESTLKLEEAARLFRAVEATRPFSAYELHIVTSVGSHQANALRGRLALPKDARTKAERLLIFAEDGSEASDAAKRAAAKEPGSMVVGGAEMVQDVVEGRGAASGDFTKVLATPGLLPLVSRSLARSLGPRGLMPSAKRGTVAQGSREMEQAIIQAKGAMDWRGDRNGVVRGAIGRINFTTAELRTNISAFLDAVVDRVSGGLSSSIQQSTMATSSGRDSERSLSAQKRASAVVKQVHLSSTQGPSVLLTLSEVY